LPSSYTSQHNEFVLEIQGFEPRFITPHPYTKQNTLTLARGPMIYCVEDVDNPWEENHFKDVIVEQRSAIEEEKREWEGESYVALRSKGRSRILDPWAHKKPGADPGAINSIPSLSEERDLVFVPYYLRSNRGGRGHMRVGLLRA
jgi:uncharacterized protein